MSKSELELYQTQFQRLDSYVRRPGRPNAFGEFQWNIITSSERKFQNLKVDQNLFSNLEHKLNLSPSWIKISVG